MIILGIETSCDETALSIIECKREENSFKILSHSVLSQIALHKEYGGVFPMLAKREHSKALVPIFVETLTKANLYKTTDHPHTTSHTQLETILEREPELLEHFTKTIHTLEKPPIDLIAVTTGPGLEPALWVGINFARALSEIWNIPVTAVNHMEGHIAGALCDDFEEAEKKFVPLLTVQYPALALLISGGHTELVLSKAPLQYEIIGQTKDDAVGEAFDKVARILGLPYPGGPEISKLAEIERAQNPLPHAHTIKLPRPMLRTPDFDFSFSGLKTAVLYAVKKLPKLTDALRQEIAREFEDAVTEVLLAKTTRAIDEEGIETLLIGGGVIANTHLRSTLLKESARFPHVRVLLPEHALTGDNATMIALAAFLRAKEGKQSSLPLKAEGTLALT